MKIDYSKYCTKKIIKVIIFLIIITTVILINNKSYYSPETIYINSNYETLTNNNISLVMNYDSLLIEYTEDNLVKTDNGYKLNIPQRKLHNITLNVDNKIYNLDKYNDIKIFYKGNLIKSNNNNLATFENRKKFSKALLHLKLATILFSTILFYLLISSKHFKNLFKKNGTKIFLFILLIFLLYFLLYNPGLMEHDTTRIWTSAQQMYFSDWHAKEFLLIFTFLTIIYDSIATLTLLNIIALTLLLTYVVKKLIIINKSKKTTYLYILIFIILSLVTMKNVLLAHKDTLFGIIVIFFAFNIYKNNNKRANLEIHDIMLISLLLFIISTIRHLGIIFIIVIPLIMFLSKSYDNKTIRKIIMISITLILYTSFLLPSSMFTTNETRVDSLSPILSPLTFIMMQDDYNTINKSKDIEIFEKYINFEIAKSRYTIYSSDPIMFDKNANLRISKSDIKNIQELAARLVIHNMDLYIKNKITHINHYFSNSRGCITNQETYYRGVNTQSPKFGRYYGQNFTFTSKTKINLDTKIKSICESKPYFLFSILYPPIIFLILSLIIFLKFPKTSLFTITLVPYTILFLAAIPSNSFRYLFYIFIAGWIIPLLLYSEYKERRRRNTER